MFSLKNIYSFHLSVIKICIFLIPFLPLYVSKSIYFPYVSGKNYAFRIAIELAAALWLVLILLKKEYRIQTSKIMLSILVFTFTVGLADILGVNPYNSFWSNYERMEGYVTILHLVLYFAILVSILRSKRDWVIFLNLCYIAGTLAALYAIIAPSVTAPRYFMEYGRRISGTLGNPPFLASYLLLVVSFGLILLHRTTQKIPRICYKVTILLNIIAIYLSSSRGPIISVLFGSAILLIYYISEKYGKHREGWLKKRAIAYSAIFVIVSIVIILLSGAEFISKDRTLSRFASLLSDSAVATRLDTWSMALHGIKERPLLGWGQDNFISLYTIVPIPLTEDHAWIDRAHNALIDWMVNAGSLGLLTYLGVFYTAISVLIRAVRKGTVRKKEGVIISIAIVTYFVQNLFTFDTVNTYILFFALLAYINNISTIDDSKRPENNHPTAMKVFIHAALIFLALAVFASVAYFVNYKPIKQAIITRLSSVIPSERQAVKPLLNNFKRALSYRTFGDTYVRRQMASVANGMSARGLFEHEEGLLFINSTAEELFHGISRNRNDLRYLSSVISLYQRISVYQPSFIAQTEALINACLRLNPEYKRLYVMLSDLYVLKNDYEGAFAAIERALKGNPDNDVLQIKLALASILTKREEIASMALEKAKTLRIAQSYNGASFARQLFSLDELYSFARAYREIKNYEKANNYYKKILNINPLDAIARHELSDIYRLAGDMTNAEEELKRIGEHTSRNVDKSRIK